MSTNNQPFFSIGIPIYNSEKYLQSCFESILNQDFKDFEIVCIDDCSKDNSRSIVSNISNTDSRVRLYEHETNKGILVTRKEISEHAKGKYFIWCDSDDQIAHGALRSLYNKIIDSKSDKICIIHGASLVNLDGREVPDFIRPSFSKDSLCVDEALGYVLANNGLRSFPWIFVTPSFQVKKAFANIPLDDPRNYVDDVLITYKYLLHLDKVIFVNHSYYKYFIRTNSDSTDPKIIKRLCNTVDYILNNLEEDLLKYKPMLQSLLVLYSSIYWAVGDKNNLNYFEIKKNQQILKKTHLDSIAKKHISKKDKILLFFVKHFPRLFHLYYSRKATRYSKGD